MRVRVIREACCAQDDQLGPLEAGYDLPPGATVGDLVAAVVGSSFLQYSSSHVSLVGFVGARRLVRVFSAHYAPGRAPEFALPAGLPAAAVVGDRPVEFRFV